MKPRNIKALQAQSRHLRAWRLDRNTVRVESISNPESWHDVTITFGRGGVIRTRCTCTWAQHRGLACSHVMAALDHLAQQKRRTLSFWTSEDEARRQKHRVFRLVGGDGVHDSGVWITSRTGAPPT